MRSILRTTAVVGATALMLAASVATAEARNFDRGGFGGKHASQTGGASEADAENRGSGFFDFGLGDVLRGGPDRCGAYGDCG